MYIYRSKDTTRSHAEHLACAGLSWGVALRPLTTPEGMTVDHQATVRTDTGALLGVVGPSYEPVQNDYLFGAWTEPFRAAGCTIEGAGHLRGGSRVWLQLAIPGGTDEVIPGDAVTAYLLAANAHDGSMSVACGTQRTRVVCQNTLQAAISESGARLRHTRGVHVALEVAQERILKERAAFRVELEKYRAMAKTKCSDANLRTYLRDVFEVEGEDIPRAVERVTELYQGQAYALPGVTGTVWGAFNAVTEWTTHARGRSDDSRFDSVLFGDSSRLNERARKIALRYVELSA